MSDNTAIVLGMIGAFCLGAAMVFFSRSIDAKDAMIPIRVDYKSPRRLELQDPYRGTVYLWPGGPYKNGWYFVSTKWISK